LLVKTYCILSQRDYEVREITSSKIEPNEVKKGERGKGLCQKVRKKTNINKRT
jgi:hypothetical protein